MDLPSYYSRRYLLAILVATVCSLPGSWALAQEQPTEAQPDKWATAMEKFAAQDKASPPKPGGILFVGSSSIVKWDLKKSFPNLPVTNRGFGGSQIADSVRHFETLVPPHQPDILVFYAGDNDVAQKKSPEQVSQDFAAFAALMKKSFPKTKCIFIPIKPSGSRWNLIETQKQANRLIKDQIEKSDQWTYLPIEPLMLNDQAIPDDTLFVKDRLHLSEAGYAKWNALLGPILEEMRAK